MLLVNSFEYQISPQMIKNHLILRVLSTLRTLSTFAGQLPSPTKLAGR